MKFKRNEKCPCKSNKKYKKCCLSTGFYERPPNEVMYRFELDTVFDRPEKTIWRKSFKNLPPDIVDKIIRVINNHNVYKGMCYRNSYYISLNIDEVEVVHGWYGWKYKKNSEVDCWWNQRKNYDSEDYGDGLYIISRQDDDYGYNEKLILDIKNRILYRRHCWNKYKDIHFDVTSELLTKDSKTIEENKDGTEKGYNNDWFHFNEIKSYDTSSLSNVPSYKEKYFEVLEYWTDNFKTEYPEFHYSIS